MSYSGKHKALYALMSGIMIVSNLLSPVSTIHAYADDNTGTSGEQKPQTTENGYVNDIPIRLQVSKVKTHQGSHEGLLPKNNNINAKDTVTYKISGRVEGTQADLEARYGTGAVEFAYKDSTYLGYGYFKGTLEYLLNRKAQNLDEDMEIVYDEYGQFAGYAYVTRKLETADDVNRYVAGATMGLYDAIKVEYDPQNVSDRNDDGRFKGVTVLRSVVGAGDTGTPNVSDVYVEKGYAGTEIKYVKQRLDQDKLEADRYNHVIDHNYSYGGYEFNNKLHKTTRNYLITSVEENGGVLRNENYENELNDKGDYVWIAETVQRDDTPILYYSFADLRVTSNDQYAGLTAKEQGGVADDVFGYYRFNKSRQLYGLDKDKNVINISQLDERDFSIYAFRAGSTTPVFEFVDDPDDDITGSFDDIRYIESEGRFVLPKGVLMYHLDENGNRDSLVDPQTGIAYVKQDGDIYVWPVEVTYDGSGAGQGNASGSKTFRKIMTSRIASINADTADEYVYGTVETGSDGKEHLVNYNNEVLDVYGHPVYYRQSQKAYVKGNSQYDFDGEEYLGWQYSDQLDDDNKNAYNVNNHHDLYNGDDNDPFDQSTHYQFSKEQTAVITIDVEGNYIVDGAHTVPEPVSDSLKFSQWLKSPKDLQDGDTINAYWTASGMSSFTKERWYSDRAAEPGHTTRTVTVAFNATDGEFRNDNGDPHSTDRVLYHRYGEAAVIPNIWVSGENTPNDPFDIQKADTVRNTAAGSNTFTASGLTGNDVYSESTSAGGEADMLKRVYAGTYIMEEIEAPDGYAKGLPVGITVKESDQVQTAEMVDKTIKAEIIKVDAPVKRDENVYLDGIQKSTDGASVFPDNSNAEIYVPKKGEYSYKHVTGAKLTLTARDYEATDKGKKEYVWYCVNCGHQNRGSDGICAQCGNYRNSSLEPLENNRDKTRKEYSDWVKTSSIDKKYDYVTKKQDKDGWWYLEWDTDKPLFVEGIPAGDYTVTESQTPAGYVKAQSQDITISSTGLSDVQVYQIADDHIKVAIDKYYMDGKTKKHMPNSARATMTLTDTDGTLADTWQTDDTSLYTGSVPKISNEKQSVTDKIVNAIKKLFGGDNPEDQSLVEYMNSLVSGNPDLSEISWNAVESAAKQADSTDAKEHWKTSDGTDIYIPVTDGSRDFASATTENGTMPSGFEAAYADQALPTDGANGASTIYYTKEMYAARNTDLTPHSEAHGTTQYVLSDQIWDVYTKESGQHAEKAVLKTAASDGHKERSGWEYVAQMHVSVEPDNLLKADGGESYSVSFMFNYRHLAGKYAGTVSYDTTDGLHHFDYIPAGTYTVDEAVVPVGYVKTTPKAITVLETEDVQQFSVENKEKKLTAAKVGYDTEYFAGMEDNAVTETDNIRRAAVIEGAELTMYYSSTPIADYENAFKDGSVPEGAVQVDQWISGHDGVYTKNDVNNIDVFDYNVGDYKPHVKDNLENGYYYIVESDVPGYYVNALVREVAVTDETVGSLLGTVYIVDKPMPLNVIVEKSDGSTKLGGAVFQIDNKTLGIDNIGTITTADGTGQGSFTIKGSDIGRFDKDGHYIPYTFEIHEISAPEGYKLNDEIYEFQASADGRDGTAYIVSADGEKEEIRDGILYVDDQPSQVTIRKGDFLTGDPVSGTKFAVHEAKYNEDTGKWEKTDVTNANWQWTAGASGEHDLYGLVQGHTYVLEETAVPDGYTLTQEPVYFRVNSRGTAIDKIWLDASENPYVEFGTDETGSVSKVTVNWRSVAGSYVEITDLTDGSVNKMNKGVSKDGTVTFAKSELTERHRYQLVQYVTFTDKEVKKLSTAAFDAEFTHDGRDDDTITVPLHTAPKDSTLTIADQEGQEIINFKPSKDAEQFVMDNAVADQADNLDVHSYSKNQVEGHAAVTKDSIINYRVTYSGTGKNITILKNSGLNYDTRDLTEDGFTEDENGNYTLTTSKESGTLEFAAYVNDKASGDVNQIVLIGGTVYSYMNVVAENAGQQGTIFYETSKLNIANSVTGTDPDNVSRKFRYKITLTKKDGSPLSGAYVYHTKDANGRLEAFGNVSEFYVDVTGNDYILIQDLPYNTQYTVTQIVDKNNPFKITSKNTTGETNKKSVVTAEFTNKRDSGENRETFKKNTAYTLTETLNYMNGTSSDFFKLGFALDDKAMISKLSVLNRETRIVLYKYDITNGNTLTGAKYSVLEEKDGEKVPVTTADGSELIAEIANGTLEMTGELTEGKDYYLRELVPPTGYALEDDVKFTVDPNGIINNVVLQDKPTRVKIQKTDDQGTALEGASLILYKEENGERVKVSEWVSEASTAKAVEKLPIHGVYIIHEQKPSKGYAYADDIRFSLDDNGNIVNAEYIDENGNRLADASVDSAENLIKMADKPIVVNFTKEDFAGHEVAGAVCEVKEIQADGTTKTIDHWTSEEGKKHTSTAVLEAGKTYRFHEEAAPEGYQYSQEIEFSIDNKGNITAVHYVNEDGQPVLYDKDGYPTGIVVNSDGTYSDNGKNVTIDANGNAVDEEGNVHGEGVQYEIKVTEDNGLMMKDAPTRFRLIKTDEDGSVLPGAEFEILDENLASVTAVRDTEIPSTVHDGNIQKGEALIFTSTGNEDGVYVENLLDAGKAYTLRETKAPSGHIPGPDQNFTIPYYNTKADIVVTASNKKTRINFTKTDFAGVELPGATCVVKDDNGNPIDTWVSTNIPHTIIGKLDVGKTYSYHEDQAPEGYGYSEDIEFTVNEAGEVVNVHYVNEYGQTILYDSEGFPTTIVKHDNGTYTDGDKTITIDKNGNAVDEAGVIHAKGVKEYIEVTEDNGIKMKDAPTDMLFVKEDNNETRIDGGLFQILNKDNTPVRAVKDTRIPSTVHDGCIEAGEPIIFAATADGVDITGQLEAGEAYYVHEIMAPNGYCMTDDAEFHIPYLNQKEPLKVTMRNLPTYVEFVKTDFATSEEVPGAFCQITDENGNVVVDTNGSKLEWTSTKEAHTIRAILTPGKTYYYHEQQAPNGYGYSEDVSFTVNVDGSIQKVEMKDKQTHVEFVKTDFATSEEVPGAFCQILDKNGNVLTDKAGNKVEWTSDGTPHVIEGILQPDETYYYHEEQSPDGYGYAEDIAFTVNHDGSVQKVEMQDRKTHVEFTKTDLTTSEELPGAHCQIIDKNGNVIDEWVSNGTPHVIEGVLKPDETYYYHEAGAPDGYGYAEDIEFTVNHDGTPQKVEMKDRPTRVEFIKTDFTTSEELPGAHCQIIDKNGNVIDEWTSNGTPHVIEGVLHADETYYYHEEGAPDGYGYAEDISFTVNHDGSVQKVEMHDSPVSVKFVKENTSGTKLSGGTFTIIRKSDGKEIIPEFRLDGEKISTKELEAGETYLMHEVKAPSGYLTSSDVEFRIPRIIEDGETFVVRMTDVKKSSGGGGGSSATAPEVTFYKYDGTTMEAIAGAEITIYNPDGTVYRKVTTGADGRVNVSFNTIGTFTYKETKAPDGYEPDDTVHTLQVDKSMYKVENVVNYKIPEIPVSKQDITTSEELPGAYLMVKDQNGNTVDEWMSTNEVHYIRKHLPDGDYTLTEITSPYGYEVSETVRFHITGGMPTGKVVMYDKPKTEHTPEIIEKVIKRIGRLGKTGESNLDLILAGVFTAAVIGAVIAGVSRKKKGHRS